MSQLLTEVEIDAGLAGLPDWTGGSAGLSRTVEMATFPLAIEVVDRVAGVAERFDHHPDIDIRWRRLTFFCVTHSAGGVTARDLELAARIESIIQETNPSKDVVR